MLTPGTKLVHAGKGLGYKPDLRHLAGLPFADATPKLAALPRAAAGAATMAIDAAVVEILDQGQAPFCVSHGTVQAVRTLEVLNGATPAPPLGSRLWIMYLAHALEDDTAGFDGAVISDAFQAIAQLGLPPESFWPYSDQNPGPFSTKPPAEVFRQAYDAIRPWHATRIVTEGDSRIDDIRTALANKLPVVFGTQVTEDLCEGKTGPDFTVDVPQDANLAGGHCMMLAGDDPANQRCRVIQSWGKNWGDNGRFWITYGYLQWVLTQDIWIVDFKGAQS